MRLKQLICAVAMCASTITFATAAPAYEVKTEAAAPDPADSGVVYGVEEAEEYGFNNAADVVAGICAIAVIGVAAGYVIEQRKKDNMHLKDGSYTYDLLGSAVPDVQQENTVPAVFKDRECDVHIVDKPDGTADLVIESKDAYWTDTFSSHAQAEEFAQRYGFKTEQSQRKG